MRFRTQDDQHASLADELSGKLTFGDNCKTKCLDDLLRMPRSDTRSLQRIVRQRSVMGMLRLATSCLGALRGHRYTAATCGGGTFCVPVTAPGSRPGSKGDYEFNDLRHSMSSLALAQRVPTKSLPVKGLRGGDEEARTPDIQLANSIHPARLFDFPRQEAPWSARKRL